MREIRISLPEYIEDDTFDDVWNSMITVLNSYVPKHDWNIEEVDE